METSAHTISFKGRSTATEWPTVFVLAAIVSLFGLITWFHARMPAAAFIVGLGIITAWWSSLQHELLHGHPFPNRRLNDAIGQLSLALWLPYPLYKTSHLRHHRNELTDPFEDPETFYCTEDHWTSLNRFTRSVLWANRTLLGRFFIGPLLTLPAFCRNAIVDMIRRRDRAAAKIWLVHAFSTAVTCVWAFGICRIPVWHYLLGAVWLGTSLVMIRSFAEHRWVADDESRAAMVHAAWPFALLFLNNNLHHAHHARPNVPWYELPRLASFLESSAKAESGAGLYRGYWHLAGQYLVRPFDGPVHPSEAVGAEMRLTTMRRSTVTHVAAQTSRGGDIAESTSP